MYIREINLNLNFSFNRKKDQARTHQSHQYAQLVGYDIRPQGTLNNIFKKIQQIFWPQKNEPKLKKQILAKITCQM